MVAAAATASGKNNIESKLFAYKNVQRRRKFFISAKKFSLVSQTGGKNALYSVNAANESSGGCNCRGIFAKYKFYRYFIFGIPISFASR